MNIEGERECIIVSKSGFWVNAAPKIKYGIYDRLGKARRVRNPEHSGRIGLRKRERGGKE